MAIEGLLIHGTVNSLMNNEEVKDPVIQIIGISKIAAEGKNEEYRLQISDGQNSNANVVLETTLNCKIYSGELTQFAIVQLKDYSLNMVPTTRRQVLVILDLQVLDNGCAVGFKIGNPQPITHNSVQVVGDGSKLLNSTTKGNHSTIIKYEEILTKGSLFSIMNNEIVNNAVVQMLDTRMTFDNGQDQRYRMLISDGQNLSSFVLLGRQLNGIIYSGELTQFTIFQIKHYLIFDISANSNIIIITDLDVLINGHKVGSKIGDPKLIINNSQHVMKYGMSDSVMEELFVDYLAVYHDYTKLFMIEYELMLTTGSLESIINNEIIESSMQVLKIEEITNCLDNARYRLLLSDGHISSSFAMLGSALNNKVTTGELHQFSIIRIQNHIISEISITDETSIHVMIIKALRVLAYGELVGLKIGDPKPILSPENDTENYNDVLSQVNDVVKISNPQPTAYNSVRIVGDGSITLNSTTKRNHYTIIKYEDILSKDALNFIMKNEEVKDPVFQILGTRKILIDGVNERYRLLISDGQNLSSFAILGSQLSRIIDSGELTQFTIIQVKDYAMVDIDNKPIISITDVDVLMRGHKVGLKIGDPKQIVNNSCLVVGIDLSDSFIDKKDICLDFNRLSIIEYEEMLTTGSCESIMNNIIAESSMQVLKIEKITNVYYVERYRLLLSDGHNSSSFVMLGSALNNIVKTGELNQFSIIRIMDHLICELANRNNEKRINVMIINKLRVLVSGELVGYKIGDPKPINPENNSEKYNDILSELYDSFLKY